MARTVKEHLATHHARSASFDVGVGAELEKLRKCFAALETNADGDDVVKKVYGDAREAVDRLGTLFNAHGEYHRSMMAETAKAEDIDDLGKRLVPTEISAVYDPSKSGVRPVIRAGQREISGTGAMPQVAEGFENLVKVGDDRE